MKTETRQMLCFAMAEPRLGVRQVFALVLLLVCETQRSIIEELQP